MGGGFWRMAGESPPFPSPRVPKRPDAALGVGMRARCRRRGLSAGGHRHGRTRRSPRIRGEACRRLRRRVRQGDGGDRATHSRKRRSRACPGLERQGLSGASRPPTTRRACGGIGARPCLAWSGAEPHRFPAACADRRSAQHSPDGAGDAMVRSARPRSGAVSGGGADRHRGDGMGSVMPRCRGAKSRVSLLHELPKGAHCSSCNIDYERNFSRNVELTFHPEPWIRPLPDGEMCVLGQGSARHVKFQGEVAAWSAKAFDLSLPPGPYRFRTVEAGAEVDGEIGADGVIPTLVARGRDILLEGASAREELAIRNESERPLVFVVEDRNWARDALTGERVIAMPAFRRLCPEQLLRPGDNAEIAWIAIMFTDLKGSTELYDALGDVTAYNLVRDHFAFLSDRVERNHGFIVKTVGDAVMAAFLTPR